MDSDDDWVDEGGEDYGSDHYSDGGYGTDDGGADLMDDVECVDKERPSQSYRALSEADIRQLQEDAIDRVCSVLSISRVGAALLLGQYQWSVREAEEAWFSDEDGVRKSIGLLENPEVKFPDSRKKITCRICFDKFRIADDMLASAACGHFFCKVCWSTYIRISVEDGTGCLKLRCPEPSCVAAIGQDTVHSLASEEVKGKYDHYLLRSYVESNKRMKWCPAPGCDNAVEFELGSEFYDVYCLCLNGFCWNCGEDAHRPVDCETVSKWVIKNSAESENVNWLLANSKPCPKCKLPIEKNQGCMHMTCRPPCKHEFCWLCLGSWKDHGERTGGFYSCNKYSAAQAKGELGEEEQKREMAKNYIQKYTHYFERWQSNEKSRKKALSSLQEMKNVHIKKLSIVQDIPETELRFIVDAWVQIVECRRVLKWTYAYGYYLPDDEIAKKQLFEYLQGEAEAGLERLHGHAEKELLKHIDDDGDDPPPSNFKDFQRLLLDLTRVTRTYFDNLVRALENGLSEVAGKEVCANAAKSMKERPTEEEKGRKGTPSYSDDSDSDSDSD